MTELQSNNSTDKANKFLQNSLFHVFGFSVYPILFLYIRNRHQIDFSEALVASFVSMIIAFCLLLFFNMFLKHFAKAGLAVSYFFFYFFSYGPAFESLHLQGFVSRANHFWPALLWSLLCLYCLYKIIKTKSFIKEITLFFNVTALTFCLISAIHLVKILFPERAFSSGPTAKTSTKLPKMDHLDDYLGQAMKLQAKKPLPDIYYFILDGYARQDILKDMYGYDNSSFIDFLKSKGFFVADKSCSNYCQTCLSLPSSLNSVYLDELSKCSTNSYSYTRELISNSAISKILRFHGYEIVTMQSHSSLYDLGGSADRYIRSTKVSNAFFVLLVKTTILSAIDSPWLSVNRTLKKSLCQMIEDSFPIPPKIMLGNKPVFFFAHIHCPHPPFFFGPGGERKDVADPTSSDGALRMNMTPEEYRKGYVDQIQYANLKTKKLIEDLLSLPQNRQRIIILQSDHGPGSELVWEDAAKTNHRERMSILNSIYSSDGQIAGLRADVSPVNTFRLILNHIFNSDIEILSDRSYFSTLDNKYDYIEVTEKVYQ